MELLQQNMSLVIGAVAVIVVGLGVVIGIINARGGPKLAARWAHGVYGLWSGAEDSGTWANDRAQQSLKSWYGITDRPSLMKMVESLKQGSKENAAWDMVRAVDLLRMGFAAGYLDDDDCWEKVRQVALVLQKHHTSWEELGSSFERGMHGWQNSRNITDENERNRVQRNLPILRSQVWPKVKFSATWD